MTLNYVTLTLDLYDGQGNPVISGSAAFTPSAVLTDAGTEIISQQPLTAVFHAGGLPVIRLLATDSSGPAPAGWAWSVTFAGISGAPAAFSFFLPHADGAAQLLSDLAPVASPSLLAAGSVPGAYVVPSGDTSGAADTALIQALENLGTKAIYFAAGTFWVTGLTKQANTIWQGSGRFATIIKLAAGANADVVQGANFSTLTLSGSTTGGIGGWGIRDLTIDGNKASQSGTSHGIRVYGYNFDLTRVSIKNCLTDCLYTEWGGAGGSGVTDGTMEAVYTALKLHDFGGNGWHNRGPHDSRAYDVTIYNPSTTGYGYWAQTASATTVAAGSNGVNVSTFAGAGTLNVATTLNFPAASITATQGSLTAATSGGTAVITYTGVTATTFTGCTTVSGTGTLSTGGAVSTQAFDAAACLIEGAHVWGSPLWDYVLDTQTHLTDCVGEVAQPGGGMILARGGGSQVTGGYYVVYSGITANGCGLQIGDTVNACTGLRADTFISGLSGADAAHAALNVVNDNGGSSVDALVYQPSGTVMFGTPNAQSRYRVYAAGAAASVNAVNSLDVSTGTVQRVVPAAATTAWRLTPAGGATDALNYNSTSNRLDFNNGMLMQGWSGAYTGSVFQLDLAKGHLIWPSTTAPGGAIVTAAVGTSGNGAAVTVTGNDRRGKITITTASSGLAGSWPATAANFTFATAYGTTPRVTLTPWDGPSALVHPYCQGFSTTQFLIGFGSTPAISTTYSFTYVVDG